MRASLYPRFPGRPGLSTSEARQPPSDHAAGLRSIGTAVAELVGCLSPLGHSHGDNAQGPVALPLLPPVRAWPPAGTAQQKLGGAGMVSSLFQSQATDVRVESEARTVSTELRSWTRASSEVEPQAP